MREKELRVALVCGGGISLAVYMHGITKEILKLVRASAALHKIPDRTTRATAAFFDGVDRNDPEYDTEPVYFELLREIGRTVELRVIVDIIAGASAGGINGTMLARALCHDLPIGSLRDLWLRNADVGVLLAADARARRWSKWFVRPLIWAAGRIGMVDSNQNAEIRENLSLFVRSRWFKPPLDGGTMAGLMYDAVMALGTPANAGASLLPTSQSLDLFVTVTDYYGQPDLIAIHDPPLIHELEHHHVLHFSYRREPSGRAVDDFEADDAPALAFAARATSSFPGAFPPARIVEMDAVVAARGGSWPKRGRFIARNFERHLRLGVDPTTTSFLDGSILNNRPFREAISAIHGRPAYRQVDRRLVYIDPDPARPASAYHGVAPGFFSTLRGSLSDIPSSQPVADELNWVRDFNDRARRLRAIIESARPGVSRIVTRVVTADLNQPVSAAQLRAWREEANERAVRDSGFAAEAYVRLKLASARAFIGETIVKLRGVPRHSPLTRVVAEIIDAWAAARGLDYNAEPGEVRADDTTSPTSNWVKFLLAFDIGYRERRLQFLIEGQNRLYALIDHEGFRSLEPALVDRLKRELYGRLGALRAVRDADAFDGHTADLVEEIFPTVPSSSEIRNLPNYAQAFVARHGDRLSRLVESMAMQTDLDAGTREIDELLAKMDVPPWPGPARREVLINYLGFPYWDVLTFPVMSAYGSGEFNEILIDRISPHEASVVNTFEGTTLKGTGFGHFAAFLSRAYRENDYLLGRLHAVDRLIDIVCDSAAIGPKRGPIDVIGLKQRAFRLILDAEEPHLIESAELLRGLRSCVEAMTAA